MKITLTQVDVEEALRAYLEVEIPNQDFSSYTFVFSMTRGSEGLTAEVTNAPIEPEVKKEAVQAPEPTERKKRGPYKRKANLPEPTEPAPEATPLETAIAAVPAEEPTPVQVEEEVPFVADEAPVEASVSETRTSIFADATPAELTGGTEAQAETVAGSDEPVQPRRASLFG